MALVPTVAGRDKLEPRFMAILAQTELDEKIWDMLGDANVRSASLFGTSHLCGQSSLLSCSFQMVCAERS